MQTKIKIHKDSHLDHGLTDAHLEWVCGLLVEVDDKPVVSTLRFPDHLPPLPCALHSGVPEGEAFYEVRGDRNGKSRMCRRENYMTRVITLVTGHHDGQDGVLFTAYGGPEAKREPWDVPDGTPERCESESFWSTHALGVE